MMTVRPCVQDLDILWGSRSRPPALSSGSCRPFVLVDQATKNRSTLDPFVVEVGHGVGRLRWTKFAGTVRPSTVVMANVLREHQTQVPLPKINIRSVSSARRVRTNRSAKQFARGQRGGIRTTWMPTSARTASKDALN